MSTRIERAQKWTCDRCGVSTSRIDGKRTALPDSWASSAEGAFCLGCRRERAAEAALDSAPSDSAFDARSRLRRAALIEFEVRRTPEQANNAIARACHSSVAAVAKVRESLHLAEPSRPSS
jgi:hypothetical protein